VPEVATAQGHLWRSLREERALSLSAPAEAALGWASGLLQGKAAHTFIVPVTEGGRANGVLELGFDHEPSEPVVNLLEQAATKLGLELRSAAYREEVQ